MKNEAQKYAEMIRDDIRSIYYGSTKEVNEYGETLDIWSWVCSDNVLDFETIRDSSNQLIGVNLYVTIGGPCCWIDTRNNEVVCKWGTDTGRAWLAGEICDEINEVMSEVCAM